MCTYVCVLCVLLTNEIHSSLVKYLMSFQLCELSALIRKVFRFKSLDFDNFLRLSNKKRFERNLDL